MIAVISDVHGNLPALEAVLADIAAAGITRVWCLGDTLGYGPFANECMALVGDRCEIVLAGNHDLAVRGDIPAKEFGGTAGAGVQYTLKVLDDRSRELLAPLKARKFLPEIEMYHASADDPVWEYVLDEKVATKHIGLQRAPLSLVGHSHRQLAFELVDGAKSAAKVEVHEGDSIELTAGTKRVINPGSVGQPRDRNPRAAWLQLEATRATFRRVDYDIPRMREAVIAAELPLEIADRLDLGW